MLRELQRHFRAAVTTPEDGALSTHVATPRGAIVNRIDVYRTNVQASLADLLATAFPVVRRIVGDRFFDALAGAFIAASLPRVPQLSVYGAELADFIARYAPARTLPYLADVAWLEWARSEAYFAADAPTLDPTALQQIAPERIGELRLTLHPATRLMRSRFPVARIWAVNQSQNTDVPALDMSMAENVLLTRPRSEVVMREISSGDAILIATLADRIGLAEAAAKALETQSDFDLQRALQTHLLNGTFRA